MLASSRNLPGTVWGAGWLLLYPKKTSQAFSLKIPQVFLPLYIFLAPRWPVIGADEHGHAGDSCPRAVPAPEEGEGWGSQGQEGTPSWHCPVAVPDPGDNRGNGDSLAPASVWVVGFFCKAQSVCGCSCPIVHQGLCLHSSVCSEILS